MSHRLLHLRLDDLEYAKGRIAMYNELPTKGQLLEFIFEVESRIDDIEYAKVNQCPQCSGLLDEDEE